MKCGVCGHEICKENRWEIVNHYGKNTYAGKNGLRKVVYTFCGCHCLERYMMRSTGFVTPNFYDLSIISKSVRRKK